MNLSESYRHRIQKLAGLLKESDSTDDLTIPAGHKLFHGTGEEFDYNKSRPGGYDGVFWTTEQSAISQSYIPVAGMSIYTNTEYLSKPSTRRETISIQKQFGIEYSDVVGNSHVESYKEAPVFNGISDAYYESWNKYNKLMDVFEKFKKELSVKWPSLSPEEKNEEIRQEIELKDKIEQAKKEYFANDIEKKKNKYVNEKLAELGYEPREVDSYRGSNSWKLKVEYNGGEEKVLPADYRHQGRLFIITPKENLKIFDYTAGGTREASLLDPDYHKVELFRKVEEAGYDGIKIPDHAQIESEGNFGHHSIGLFKNAMSKVSIEEIPAVHPKDFGDKHYMAHDYDSDEYKAWKTNQVK